MNTFQFVLKAIFLSMISLNFSCSSINKSAENKNLGVTKVQPVSPISSVSQESDLAINTVTNSTLNPQTERKITDEDIFQGRDMSQYNKDNTSNCNTYKCVQIKLRNFIWRQWQNKKRGYIENRLAGIDVSITDHIFIESDEEGKWKIDWKIVKKQSPRGIDIIDFVGINTVEQVRGKFNKSSRELVFKNKNGEIIKTL